VRQVIPARPIKLGEVQLELPDLAARILHLALGLRSAFAENQCRLALR